MPLYRAWLAVITQIGPHDHRDRIFLKGLDPQVILSAARVVSLFCRRETLMVSYHRLRDRDGEPDSLFLG